MRNTYLTYACFLAFGIFVIAFAAAAASAQTSAFTFQGRLTDNTASASGTYQMRFALYDASEGGTQIGTTIENPTVPVNYAVFTVQLDYGAAAFTGAERFLEISVRRNSSEGYVVLNPRQRITSAPHAVRSLNASSADNATNLGGTPAGGYVQTTDARLSDERNPVAGSANYIQNSATQQASSNFNISGSGTAGGALSANVVNAEAQYNIGGDRVLSTGFLGSQNLFVGIGAGNSAAAVANSMFGYGTGRNTTGQANTFFGMEAGPLNTTGEQNSFFGYQAGLFNITGRNNTLIGYRANVQVGGLLNATALGSNAVVGESNTIRLGDSNVIGVDWGNSRLRKDQGGGIELGGTETIVGTGTPYVDFHKSHTFPQDFNVRLINDEDRVLSVIGSFRVGTYMILPTLGVGGTVALCRDSFNTIATCGSSLRYKGNIASFSSGLDLIKRLQPITFNWKNGGMADLGLGAEDVAAIEPLLVTYNSNGQVEGVKYDRVGVVLINAVKEQQEQLREQNRIIEALRMTVCSLDPKAAVCVK